MRWVWFACGLLTSLGLSLYITPLVRRGALSFGVLDRPDGALKTQREAVPYLGGIAVYLAFLLSISMVFDFGPQLLGLLLGGTIMAMLGLFDDLRVLPPNLKLLGQLLAVWVLIKCDITIRLVLLPPWAATLLTMVWLVGITNALNLVDVSDGLASGIGVVASLALCGVALRNDNDMIAMTALVLAGALAGFWAYNRAPARIYLGDTGSLFVGFMLAALSMIGSYTEHNALGALAPVAILCVPILETLLLTAARLSRGISPLRGSPDHFAIRLKKRQWTADQVMWAAVGVSLLGAAVAALLIASPWAAWAAAGSGLVGAGLVGALWRCKPPGA